MPYFKSQELQQFHHMYNFFPWIEKNNYIFMLRVRTYHSCSRTVRSSKYIVLERKSIPMVGWTEKHQQQYGQLYTPDWTCSQIGNFLRHEHFQSTQTKHIKCLQISVSSTGQFSNRGWFQRKVKQCSTTQVYTSLCTTQLCPMQNNTLPTDDHTFIIHRQTSL